MKNFLKTLWKVIWPLLLYYAVTMAVTAVLCVVLAGKQILAGGFDIDMLIEAVMDSSMIQVVIVSLIMIPLMWIAIRKERTIKFNAPKPKVYISMAICAACAAAAVNFFVYVAGLFYTDPLYDVIESTLTNSPLWIEIIAAVIIGPIAEEVIFRGKIYESVDNAYGPVAAIIVSSVLFGIFHGNITQFLYATTLGVLFAYVRYKTGSLTITMIMHMAANLGSVMLDSLAELIPFPNIMYADLIIECLGTMISLGIVVICLSGLKNDRRA